MKVVHTTTTLEQLLHDLFPARGQKLISLIDDSEPVRESEVVLKA
jgi:hypothetical protein